LAKHIVGQINNGVNKKPWKQEAFQGKKKERTTDQ